MVTSALKRAERNHVAKLSSQRKRFYHLQLLINHCITATASKGNIIIWKALWEGQKDKVDF